MDGSSGFTVFFCHLICVPFGVIKNKKNLGDLRATYICNWQILSLSHIFTVYLLVILCLPFNKRDSTSLHKYLSIGRPVFFHLAYCYKMMYVLHSTFVKGKCKTIWRIRRQSVLCTEREK